MIVVALIAVAAGAVDQGAAGLQRGRAAQAPEQRYKLVTIEKGDVTQTVSANGTLNPVMLISVGTQVSGTVRKLFVDFNDKVKKGQPLLELDDALVAASERQSAANVINAQAALDLAQIAAQVHLSAGTVRNHLSSAIGKTGTATRAEAARVARERGWI